MFVNHLYLIFKLVLFFLISADARGIFQTALPQTFQYSLNFNALYLKMSKNGAQYLNKSFILTLMVDETDLETNSLNN